MVSWIPADRHSSVPRASHSRVSQVGPVRCTTVPRAGPVRQSYSQPLQRSPAGPVRCSRVPRTSLFNVPPSRSRLAFQSSRASHCKVPQAGPVQHFRGPRTCPPRVLSTAIERFQAASVCFRATIACIRSLPEGSANQSRSLPRAQSRSLPKAQSRSRCSRVPRNCCPRVPRGRCSRVSQDYCSRVPRVTWVITTPLDFPQILLGGRVGTRRPS